MDAMFSRAGSFNKDLSRWCVTLITEKPIAFASNTLLTQDQYPVWGTCPADAKNITLSYPTGGPVSETIHVPKNGQGYTYFSVEGENGPFNYHSDFEIDLLNLTQSAIVKAPARFLEDNLIQLEIPYEMVQADETTQFQLEESFRTGSTSYQLNGQEVTFSATPMAQNWTRTWSIFAEGSAGVSGCLGCVGAGASVSAAKVSIKGTGGMGLNLMLNDRGERFFTRRADIGIAVGAETPSFNLIDESIKLDVGASAELATSVGAGQTFSFSNLDINEDQKKLAETGFLLETLSLNGAALSPTVGIFLPAIVKTINKISGVDQLFEPANMSNFSGFGLEGTIGAGIGAEIGPWKFKAAEVSSGFVLSTRDYLYSNLGTSAKYGEELIQPININGNVHPIHSAIEMKLATAYDMSLLKWDLYYTDNESGETGTFSPLSLFSYGNGSELSMVGNFDQADNLHSLEFGLTDGHDIELLTLERSKFQSTQVRIPGYYSSTISENGLALTSLFEPGIDLLFGKSLAADFEQTFNLLSKDLDNDYPLEVVNYGIHGLGFNQVFGRSFDGALGAGVGLSIGFEISLYDEIKFPNNYVEVYNGGKNFTKYTTNYSQQMAEETLANIFADMFSGTVALAKDALNDFIELYTDLVESGTEFIKDLANRTGTIVGNITGFFTLDGTFITKIFSPDTERVQQKAFDTPQVRSMYSSPNVFYHLPAKSAVGNKKFLAETGSELIVISDVMDLSFTPEGSSDTLSVLAQPIEIEMIIYETDLTDNDFLLEDKESVNLYRYINEETGWVRVDGVLNDNVVKADITTLGSYALGIEINRSDDAIAPDIYDSGYLDATDNGGTDEIFAQIRDDRYGTGVDFGNTFMIVNEDTVGYSYQPADERIFFDLTDYSNLSGGTEDVKIIATDFNGNESISTFSFERVTTNTDEESALPDRFVLRDNYPNPFNPQTVIPFELAESANVEINIYDVAGRYITTLLDERMSAGSHQVTWNTSVGQGRELSSGVYFYQVKSGNFNQVKKMMLIK